MADLPIVTCLCPTYGRFARLREALACFLAQDYPNKQLLILNDAYIPIKLPGVDAAVQTPAHLPLSQSSPELPGVRVWNSNEMFSNLGEKRQALLKAANSPFVAHWDDDDLYLPWHLSHCMAALRRPGAPLRGPRCVKPRGAWYMVGQLPKLDVHGIHHNVFEGQIVFNRLKALKLGGYTPKHSGQALDLMRAFGREKLFGEFDPYPFVSYVYRWGCGVGHISAYGNKGDSRSLFRTVNADFGGGPTHPPRRTGGQPLTPADLTPYWDAILGSARKEFSNDDYEAFEARLNVPIGVAET